MPKTNIPESPDASGNQTPKMWKCLRCKRNFKITNQSHTCVVKDIGELFIGKPDELVLAFDAILRNVEDWEPNTYGASKNAVVFTSKKAWLIIKPMKTELDVKFYSDLELESNQFHKVGTWGRKFAYHLRIRHEDQVDEEFIQLIGDGYRYSLR